MNKNRKFLVLLMLVLVLATSIFAVKDIIAAEPKSYRTTIINEDGLEIEVATIRSDAIIGTEEYIRSNLNSSYTLNEKFEPKDVIYVKHLLADGSEFAGEKTINAMYDGQEDAFIMMNDFATILYETDENSDYYVTFVNTLIDDPDYQVTDYCFAYTNMNGDTVSDCIYDYATGLVYVPKKYTQENKNGVGMNTQVELLQVIDSQNPTSTFNVKLDVSESVKGTFASSGKVTVEALATEFGVKVALDDEAKNDITENYFKVFVNDTETHAYKYYPNEGIIVVQALPNTIDTLEISVSFDNVDDNVDYIMQNGGISTYATWEEIPVYGDPGTWIVTDMPSEGESWYIEASNPEAGFNADLVDVYRAGAIHMGSSLPIYNEASDNNWVTIVDKIWNGGSVNLNNLAHNGTWIQHEVRFNKDITTNGITIPGGTVAWLKCSHASKSFDADDSRGKDPLDGEPRYHAWKIKVRIYKVTNDYMIVGFLTSILGGQAGTGIYKIAYTTGKGDLEVGKLDEFDEYVAGATFRITGPNGYSRDVVTEAGKRTLIEDLEKGDYTVTEITAPTNMIINSTPVTVNVSSGDPAVAEIKNTYQRGSTRLVKYDADNRNATKGDAKIGGAEFSLCAAEDIKLGSHTIYTTNQVVKSGIVTKADGTTDSVTDLPIGKYYYIETKASEGFNINTNRVPVEVKYAGQNATVAAEGYNEVPESPVYGNLYITKKLGATDLDAEILLPSVQFELTLKSDPNQRYKTNISGPDGVCKVDRVPYGLYTCKEILVNDKAYPVADFDVNFTENGKTYYYTKVDASKQMQIEIDKEILVNAGEKTDAVVEGAKFTVYTDAAGKNPYKDAYGNTVVIGPTDANGYAISKYMRTGTYYLKETTFPKGIDPDATIPGENVTYRNKVYTVSYNNQNQGTSPVKVTLTVKNEPKRNDIEIFKRIGATSNTTEAPLDKCEFTATLKSSIGTDAVFSRKCTAETDANGYCIIEDLPYGDYVVEETKVSPISLKCDNFDVNITEDSKVKVEPYSKTIVDVPKVMQIKIRKVDANRKDSDAPDFTQGDGVLKGAIYQIYRYDPQTDDYTEAVYEITVDHKDADGYWCAESRDLLVGKYMVKEKISYTEEVDGKTYNYSYAEGYLADPQTYYFDQRPDLQTVERTYHADTSKEEVIRGSVEVIKYDNDVGETDETAAEGAILRLTLNSDPSKYYDVTINEFGYGEFVEEESRDKYYPHTIPYGEYTITEVKESNAKEHTSFFIHPEPVTISKQVQKEYRIEADEPVEMYLQVQKTDKDTGADVKLEGAKFKIWDCQRKSWVSQITYPSGAYIEEFVTGEDGNLTLPHKLEAGNYIVYETEAPAGYYLEEAWRIPANEADIGNADKAGKLVKIDKAAMGVIENTTANKMDLFYSVDMPNEPLKGKLEIFKTGEMLTDASINSTEFGDKYTPIYTLKGLKGVTYDIKAAEDIKSPDGNVVYVAKGTKVDTITTGEDGFATTKELYLGEYEIIEVSAPEGYIIDEDIENVTLENEDTLTRVETTNKELTDVRQKLSLSFPKEYVEVNFANGTDEEKYSVFGIFANQDIKNVEGNVVIRKNDLVDLIRIEGEETDAMSTIDLPQGRYYIEELDASYPYSLSEEVVEVELTYEGNEHEYVTERAEGFTNTYDSSTLALIKISTSSLKELVLVGDQMDTSKLDEEVAQILNDIKGMTEAEVVDYLEANDIRFIAGAKYKIYTDKECQKPLYIKSGEEFVEAELVTGNTGMIKLEDIPLGKYFVKEVEAPKGYELADTLLEVDLTLENKDQMVYKPLVEHAVKTPLLTKTDIFTGEVIPNCTFEIKDSDGKVLLHSVTNEEGVGYIPVDLFKDGEKYTYTEIEAPDIYDLNTEPHEFEADFNEDGEWVTERIQVDNRRKTIDELIVRKLDEETGEPLEGCKFSIVLLDEDGNPYLNQEGEMVYLVKEAVTGENGEYVVEKPYYGSYQFIEVEAPEGYEMKEDMNGMTFVIDENSPDTIIFEVTNTGDIAVYALSAMAVISVIGIAYVIVKNKKQRA